VDTTGENSSNSKAGESTEKQEIRNMKTTSNRIAGDALEEQDNTRRVGGNNRRPRETSGDQGKQQETWGSTKII
jgi:hypothetical protein